MTNSSKTTGWTPERTTLARRLWAEGQSATQIGMRLGVSRCAVLSKMHREKGDLGRAAPSDPCPTLGGSLKGLGLKGLGTGGADRIGRIRRDVNRSVVRPRKELDLWRPLADEDIASLDTPRAAAPPQADAKAFAPLPGTTPRPWISRRRDECAWPVDVGEAELQYACCAPTGWRRVYCDAHRAMARDPAAPTQGELAKEADALVAWLAWRRA